MPPSPYRTTICPPITDLESFRQTLRGYRADLDFGELEGESRYVLLDNGEYLLKHCDFLETKLDNKVRIYLTRERFVVIAEWDH